MIRWVREHLFASIAILFLFLIPLSVGTLVLISWNVTYDPESDYFPREYGAIVAAILAIAAFLVGLVITGVAAFVSHWKTANAHANSGTEPNR